MVFLLVVYLVIVALLYTSPLWMAMVVFFFIKVFPKLSNKDKALTLVVTGTPTVLAAILLGMEIYYVL